MVVKRTKLGMTVEGPKKATPYDKLAERMTEGGTEEQALEHQGRRRMIRTGFPEEIERSQGKIPKVKPDLSGKGRSSKV